MMIRTLLLSLIGLTCAGQALAAPAEDYTLVAGKRAGFIAPDASEGSLRKQLPANFVKRTFYRESTADGSEGKLHCVTRLYPDSGKELWIIWKSDFTNEWQPDALKRCESLPLLQNPAYVLLAVPEDPKIAAQNSPWKTPEGVGLEMDLAQLEAANGKPVSFSVGEETDGNIFSWNDGKLKAGVNDAMLAYDTLETGERLQGYAQNNQVMSSSLPDDLKKRIKLVFFTVPIGA